MLKPLICLRADRAVTPDDDVEWVRGFATTPRIFIWWNSTLLISSNSRPSSPMVITSGA